MSVTTWLSTRPLDRLSDRVRRGLWQRHHAARILHVFVSSPGDCGAERLAVTRILEVLNKTAASRLNLLFQPVMWEDLPPGQGEPGDLQARVNTVLEHHGLKRFEIYVGFMKDRVGTPTARAISGTAEELQTALESKRKKGVPAETLFYFLRDEKERTPPVQQFAETLSASGFLYTVTSDSDAFERTVSTHLETIRDNWYTWRNRLRRGLRDIRVTATAFVVVVAAAYLWFDLGTSHRVNRALAVHDVRGAASAWSDRRFVMVIHGRSAQRRINLTIGEQLTSSGSHEATLSQLEWWRSQPVWNMADAGPYLHRSREFLMAEVDLANIRDLSANDVRLYVRADRAGLWDASGVSRSLLQRVAGKRVFATLLAQQHDPFRWATDHLTSYELQAVKSYAAAVRARPDVQQWGDRTSRVALCVVMADWRLLEVLVTEAVHKDVANQIEVAAFIGHAPLAEVIAWVSALTPEMPIASHVVARVFEAVRDRASPELTIAVYRAIVEGRLPADARDFELDLNCDSSHCGELATTALAEWLALASVPPRVVSELASRASVEKLTRVERLRLTEALIRKLSHPEFKEYSAALLHLVGRMDTPVGQRTLRSLTGDYITGRISFGVSDRRALLRSLPTDRERSSASEITALRLAQTTEQQFAELRGRYAPSDMLVQAAYLQLVASLESFEWNRHAAWLKHLTERRLDEDAAGVWQKEFDDGLARVRADRPAEPHRPSGIFRLSNRRHVGRRALRETSISSRAPRH